MKSFLVIAALIGLVSADIGIGYQYKAPHTTYGVPSYQIGSGSGYNTGYTGNSFGYKAADSSKDTIIQASTPIYTGFQAGGFESSTYKPSFQTVTYKPVYQTYKTGGGSQSGYQGTGYQTGSGYQTGNGFQTGNGYQTVYKAANAYKAIPTNTGSSQFYTTSSTNSGSYVQPIYAQGFSGQQYQQSADYQSSIVKKYQEYYNQQLQQPVQVFKHFYVHAAPEEPEQPSFRQPPPLPPAQKHYKVIFIKAPTQTSTANQFITVPQQNEEKTIVYVLQNKPEEQSQIITHKVEPKPQTPPEVYFIKYKGKEGHQQVINNIVNDYNKNQPGIVTFSGAENAGASSIADGSEAYSGVQSDVSSIASAFDGSTVNNGYIAGQGTQFASQSSSSGGDQSYNGFGPTTAFIISPSTSGYIGQGLEESSTVGSVIENKYFGSSDGGSSASAGASAISGGSADVISTVYSGESQNTDTFSTNQGVPHQSYGIPKFRVN